MKISICGDVSTTYSRDLFISGDIKALFNDVPGVFRDSDRVLVNLECALTEKETPISKKGPNLKGPLETARLLREIGATDCAISNNHIMDYGIPGVTDTINILRELGLNYTGFGDNYEDSRKNLIMEKDGVKVAIIAVCEHEYCYALENRMGGRPFDPYDTLEDVRKAKAECDYVVVTYHGGKEQSLFPSPRLRKACQAMVRSGADVVLCQHSHCIGCYEKYEGSHILYGQGNFHFTGRTDHPHWQDGLIVQLNINGKVDIDFIPVKVNGLGIELAKGEDYDVIMKGFEERSENLHNGVWLEKWAEFCEASKERYLGNIARAFSENAGEADNEIFCGRMHCEAHKDVIDWLCKHYWEQREEI